MKLVRLGAALLAFILALCAQPEISAAKTRHSMTSHHTQARHGKRHKKRARRHSKRKHAKSNGGMEF